jgi:hypothetical protein
MSIKKISNIIDINPRFLRSVNLERDFNDSDALKNYILTDFSKECFDRIKEGLKPNSTQRAWRMTGDYGSGKSSFALLLTRSLAGQNQIPNWLLNRLDIPKYDKSHPSFTSVLCTCSRKSLKTSITESLYKTLIRIFKKRNNMPKILKEMEAVVKSQVEPREDQVIHFLEATNELVIDKHRSHGILLIIDELGKFLEYAAIHSNQQDVFILQQIAELSARSGDHPFFVVCLLHQGFNAYADQLNQSAQREWEKVAGRFEEIIFNQPVEQIGNLIAAALNVKTEQIPKRAAISLKYIMEKTLEFGWFGISKKSSMIDLATKLFPLSPMVLPVLIRIFRRFGQNERSLFSFLLSNEPFGLQLFSNVEIDDSKFYCLSDLYDYVRTNFGHRLTSQSYRSHWNLIDSIIDSYATDDPINIKILKSIGILNLLNDDLLATEETIACSIAGDDHILHHQIINSIRKLQNSKRVIYNRGHARGLCLWPHTSVDLEKAYEDARSNVKTPKQVAVQLKQYIETRPIIARRHYIETGTLRHYDVVYCSVDELKDLSKTNTSIADGSIIVPLCETLEDQEKAFEFTKDNDIKERFNWLIAVPKPLNNLASLLHEVQRWEWILSNVPELNGDKFARDEVLRQLRTTKLQLVNGIQERIGFKQFGGKSNLEWFNKGKQLSIYNNRQFLEMLSKMFDRIFSESPHIQNELINRHSISGAATSARLRLLDLMLKNKTLQWLGMNPDKKPPEMSIYLSTLKDTGIHKKHGDSWTIGIPNSDQDEKCKVIPLFKKMYEIVSKCPDERIKISSFLNELRKPPYGIRDGIAPVFLTAFAIKHEMDIAFYQDGSFLRELTKEHLLELMKSPERYEIQYCKIEGVRSEIFEKLMGVLEIESNKDKKAELLDVVKPLCVFIAQLPEYVINTNKNPSITLNVKNAILKAVEPSKLLFADLPQACEINRSNFSFSNHEEVKKYIKNLKNALDDLKMTFPELQERIKKSFQTTFNSHKPFLQFRQSIASRAEQVILGVKEPKLRAFCLRIMDINLPESEWVESIGSFLALKPPSKWHDSDEDFFYQELDQIAKRFHHVESIVFSSNATTKNGTGIRLSITQASGVEYEKVIFYNDDEIKKIADIQNQIEKIFEKEKDLGLIATSKILMKTLNKKDNAENE